VGTHSTVPHTDHHASEATLCVGRGTGGTQACMRSEGEGGGGGWWRAEEEVLTSRVILMSARADEQRRAVTRAVACMVERRGVAKWGGGDAEFGFFSLQNRTEQKGMGESVLGVSDCASRQCGACPCNAVFSTNYTLVPLFLNDRCDPALMVGNTYSGTHKGGERRERKT
jgi:hypothetical protein